jgi:hypothetical protein
MSRSWLKLILVSALVLLTAPAHGQTVLDLCCSFPSDQGWDYTLIGDFNFTHAGHNGQWMFYRSGGPPPAEVYYQAPPADWAAAVATGEFSVFAEMMVGSETVRMNDPTVGLATIVAATGTLEIRLEFYPDRVALGGGSFTGTTEYAMDTQDQFHIYELYVRGNHVSVWVDGALQLDATSSSSTTAQYFRFGHVSGTNSGRSDWRALSFGGGGAVPLTMSSVSGMKAQYKQ